ncbi:MAG TPA: energy transducer TonB [Chthoniobacterales bacterium]
MGQTNRLASLISILAAFLLTVPTVIATEANRLIVTINVDHGRITNISVARSTGNPKLDNAAIQWVKKNWVFSPDKTGSFRLPVIFNKGR